MSRPTGENERYFRLSFAAALIANQFAFQGSRFLEKGRFHYDLSLPLDSAIPFLPWTISIYFGCFVFWVLVYRLVARLPRRTADRFFCANLIGKGISFLIFVFFPTTLTRPALNGMGFWDGALRLLYRLDAPDNLFPSLHCMISWLCWVGIRGNKQVPVMWRLAALGMAVAVCLATLTIRQHVLVDAAGGILLSELCYFCAGSERLLRVYSLSLDRLLSETNQIKEKLMI